MYKFFKDYYWALGKPCGKELLDEKNFYNSARSYRIVIDPYFKRYTLEKYHYGKFVEITYDSAIFDFRKLKPVEQTSWKKEIISQSKDEILSLIRDHDDRIIVEEKYFFCENLCKECHMFYPGSSKLVCLQKMYYKRLGDSNDSVILYDNEMHPIVKKEYETDSITGDFTNLLKEFWDFSNISLK